MTLRELIHGAPTPPNPPQYVAWHRDLDECPQYLCKGEGEWEWTRKIAEAHRFDTRKQAEEALPEGGRRGVLQVRGSRDS
jgi:hypothetical protein